MVVSAGVSVVILLRADDYHLANHVVILAPTLHALLKSREHEPIRIREAGATRLRKTIFENPFCHHGPRITVPTLGVN